MRSNPRFAAARGSLFAVALAALGCGGARVAPPRAASDASDTASATDDGSPLEAVLAAAVVPPEADQGPPVASMSATFSNGCVIPCGESGLGGQGPVIVSTPTDDPTYGTTQANPVRVGGVSGYHEERYLRSLWGPDGQTVRFERIGSCCPMPEGGLLDAIRVHYRGLDEPIVLYLDAYHEGPLRIPVGFTGAPARGEP